MTDHSRLAARKKKDRTSRKKSDLSAFVNSPAAANRGSGRPRSSVRPKKANPGSKLLRGGLHGGLHRSLLLGGGGGLAHVLAPTSIPPAATTAIATTTIAATMAAAVAAAMVA